MLKFQKVPSFLLSFFDTPNPTIPAVYIDALALISAADGVLSDEEKEDVLSYIRTKVGADDNADKSALEQFVRMHEILIAKQDNSDMFQEAVEKTLADIKELSKVDKSVLRFLISKLAACDGIVPEEVPVLGLLRRALD